MIQVALQWLMFSIVIILFLVYFPCPQSQSQDEQHDHPRHLIRRPSEILHSEYQPPTFRTAISVAVVAAAHFVLCAVISIVLLAQSVHQARLWAAWLGVMSMGLSAAQYIPQLWVTWRIKVITSVQVCFLPAKGLACGFSIHSYDVYSVARFVLVCVFSRGKAWHKLV
jgi:hypothetical protein